MYKTGFEVGTGRVRPGNGGEVYTSFYGEEGLFLVLPENYKLELKNLVRCSC